MKQTINIPKDCKAEITREGDNIIIEIIPENVQIKVGDWVKCNTTYILVVGITNDLLFGKYFRSSDMMYLRDGYAYMYLCTLANKEQIEHRLKSERSLMVNDKLELVPWRGEVFESILRFGPRTVCNDSHSMLEDKLYEIGNYFSEGFLTEERLNEYKETVKRLFNKWRGLK